MMWGWYGGMGWWMIFGGILFVLFWAAVITLIIWTVRRGGHESRTGPPPMQDPLDIVKERYAKGEITKEQFDQMKRDLTS